MSDFGRPIELVDLSCGHLGRKGMDHSCGGDRVVDVDRRTSNDFGEEDIRRIVREEIKLLLENIGKAAEKGQGYDTRELEDSALDAIRGTVKRAVQDFDHGADCKSRESYGSDCDCGVRRPPPNFD